MKTPDKVDCHDEQAATLSGAAKPSQSPVAPDSRNSEGWKVMARRPTEPPPDDALGEFQDSLQSFPPGQLASSGPTSHPTVLHLPGGDIPRHDTWADRAVGVAVVVVALALIAAAVYVGRE